MAKEKALNPQNQEVEEEVIKTDVSQVPAELRAKIENHIKELIAKTGQKRIFAFVVKGDEFDDKEFYIGYFRRPNMMEYSQYMNFWQKDPIQANYTVAQSVFIEGDREMVDDQDIFLYGTMARIIELMNGREAELVKTSRATK